MKASELLKSLFAGFKTSGLPIEDDLNLDTNTEQVAETNEAPKEPTLPANFSDLLKAEVEKATAPLLTEVATLRAAQVAKETAQAESEAATFAKANEAAIDALIAAFKVKPADKQAHLDRRAKDPETYDFLATFFRAERAVTGLVNAEAVLADLQNTDPAKATAYAQLQANQKALAGSGIYG